MGYALSPQTISMCYTLTEIDEKIAFYESQLERAAIKSYDKDTTQGRQKVESADIETIENLLQAWLMAKLIKTGQAGPHVMNVTFRGSRRYI